MMAGPGFSLGAGQSKFFFGLGVKKNGKVPPHLRETLCKKLLGPGAYYYPVRFGIGKPH